MLVLSRGKRESVVIGDEITLTVEEIAGQSDGRHILGATVRLGFQTPRYVSIYRSELRARALLPEPGIRRRNGRASKGERLSGLRTRRCGCGFKYRERSQFATTGRQLSGRTRKAAKHIVRARYTTSPATRTTKSRFVTTSPFPHWNSTVLSSTNACGTLARSTRPDG